MRFRFDEGTHSYIDLSTGEQLPHITGMLERTGWIDDRWYTEESSDRGVAVHRLTADYDLGALDPATCVSRFRGFLLSHVAAMQIIRPTFVGVEDPCVHPAYLFGGRPDRHGTIYGAQGVLEGKSGGPERSHKVQTALQAILLHGARKVSVPPELMLRFALYWKADGKFKLEQHRDKRDFDEARRIIRVCCGA